MVYLFTILAIGLGCAAWLKRKDRGAALFLVACGLLNAYAAADVVMAGDPYAYRLHPQAPANAPTEPDRL